MGSLTGVARGDVRILRVYVRFTPSFGRANWARRWSQIDPEATWARPLEAEHWSLTTIREKLVKIGATIVHHGRYVTFQLAEVAVPRNLFREILRRVDELRRRPAPA